MFPPETHCEERRAPVSRRFELATVLACYSLSALWLSRSGDWQAEVLQFLLRALVMSLLYFWAVLRFGDSRSRFDLGLLLAAVLLLRVFCIPYGVAQTNLLSSDLYRYLWEAKVVSAGFNPYVLPPNAEELQPLREQDLKLWQKVDHKEVPALYPPLFQLLSAMTAGENLRFRLLLAGAETLLYTLVLAILYLRGQPLMRLSWLALSPLVFIETTLNAHLDILFLPGVLAATFLLQCYLESNRGVAGSASKRSLLYAALLLLAVASLIKQTALAAFLLFITRLSFPRDLRPLCGASVLALLTVATFVAVFLIEGGVVGSVQQFSRDWRFNGHLFYQVEAALSFCSADIPLRRMLAKLLVGMVLLVFTLWSRRTGLYTALALFYFAIVSLSPLRYPWYCLSFLLFLPFLDSLRLRLLLSVSAVLTLLSYLVWLRPEHWEITLWLGLMQHLPVVVALLLLAFTLRSSGPTSLALRP